jgi:hypothetical protein
MATFLKRQKEMKRLEKQREKAERRAQKKLAPRTPDEPLDETQGPIVHEPSDEIAVTPPEPVPHN